MDTILSLFITRLRTLYSDMLFGVDEEVKELSLYNELLYAECYKLVDLAENKLRQLKSILDNETKNVGEK